MKYLLLIGLLISTQTNAGFFIFKKRQPSIPIPPKEITFTKHAENVKIPECDSLDKISCILDNAQRYYPDKTEDQLLHIKATMLLKEYSYINAKQPLLTESHIQDSFTEGKLVYDSLKMKGIEIHSIEKWQRYFVGEAVIGALNKYYMKK
jgi:hypothetical protein